MRKNDTFGGIGEFCYFDNAATTFMPDEVIEVIAAYNKTVGVSANRGKSFLSSVADEALLNARNRIKEFFGLSERHMVFYRGASYAINEIAYGLEHLIRPMDIILIGPFEHHSNYLPWRELCKRKKAILFEMPLDKNNEIDTEYLETIKDRVKIVSYSSTANTNGYHLDFNIIEHVLNRDTLVIVDDSQKCGHGCLDLSERIDCHIVNAHKMYGPKGIAGAIVNDRFFDSLKPCFFGGGMIDRVGFPNTWKDDESKFECGTMDVAAALGWLKACEYMNSIGFDAIEAKEKEYSETVRNELLKIDAVSIISVPDSASIISFFHKRIHAHDLEAVFSKNRIVIRGGNLCSQNSVAKIAMKPIIRISFGMNNSYSDIVKLTEVIRRCM